MTTPTSYDTPAAREVAARQLRAYWENPDGPLGRWTGWAWNPYADAADSCARVAARLLVRGDVEGAQVFACAHLLLSVRVSRGHEEAERRRERAEAVVA